MTAKKSRISEIKIEKMSGRSDERSTQRRQVQEAGVPQKGGQRPPPGHLMDGKDSLGLTGSAETILDR